MQLRYVFSELRQGLRRNLSMHIAVILTLFVSMTLVGLGVLLRQQSDIAVRYLGDELQVTAYLCRDRDPNPSCAGEATDAQKQQITDVIENNPEVKDYRFESRTEAFDKVKELYGDERRDSLLAAMSAEDMPESYWITLNDPNEYEGITSEVVGLDGVSQLRDLRDDLKPLYEWLGILQWGALGVAAFLVLAALLLVANTIRLAAMARRREIGIMRLVGASTLYIAIPFVMEVIVSAVIAVVLAGGALAAFMYFGVQERISESISFMPWIGMEDYTVALVVIAILAPVLTVIPTLALTGKYIKV
ncbi:permease-like cell division protein FtsX [Nocardioides sp. SYSU D00038]|uniref:permease-like cell division protein FtsX n=1 Tax=Nocardioides sp. SYSU D00038 TaxID=2812554 RepID=UPI001966DDAA|nr:permease-like cell division protein FtsX [Nocardioides sp. SYSU D00038]